MLERIIFLVVAVFLIATGVWCLVSLSYLTIWEVCI